MQTYYGGRSEVRIRKQVCEVIHTDFKSQYPSVNALLGLQELLLAEEIGIILGSMSLGSDVLAIANDTDKHTPEQWKQLARTAAMFGNKAGDAVEGHEKQSLALRNFLERLPEKETGKPETWAKLFELARALPETQYPGKAAGQGHVEAPAYAIHRADHSQWRYSSRPR
jgi:hypothetical protein